MFQLDNGNSNEEESIGTMIVISFKGNEGSDVKETCINIINSKGCVCCSHNGNGRGNPINQKYQPCRTTMHHQRVLSRNRQESHDGKQSFAVLYYNNGDNTKNGESMSNDICQFCCQRHSRLRKFLFINLDASDTKCVGQLCCSYCESVCRVFKLIFLSRPEAF